MPQATYTIDLTQLLVAVISLVFPIVGFFASLAFNALADKWKVQANDRRRVLMERALANGIAKMQEMASSYAKQNGTLLTKDERIKIVADHVATTALSVQRDLHIGPDELIESIKARLPEAKAAVEVAKQDATVAALMPVPKPCVQVIP